MAKIVLSTLGSLGDLHPMIALALEMRRRGHAPTINTWEGYREKIRELGLGFAPLRPDVDIEDKEIHVKALHAEKGPEFIIREVIMPRIREMFDDINAAARDADALITGEIVYAAMSVAELSGIKWISTSLAPLSMFSASDPSVYPQATWIETLRPLPAFFHQALLEFVRWNISDWFTPYREFRRELGLSADHDPVFRDKFSPLLHLAMFSRVLGAPQPDWPASTVQTGACYYDESSDAPVDEELLAFINVGDAPIVFTLGSAAVLDARDFFDVSVEAAKRLGRRALLLHGRGTPPPAGLDRDIAAFEYAPYSQVFPRAECIVHQGGVGTTGQAIRAGVPQLIMPFSHDQPDNAARCRRAGLGEVISRDRYTVDTAVAALKPLLERPEYRARAVAAGEIARAEGGVDAACESIENVLCK